MVHTDIVIVSDSTGETGDMVARAWTSQFDDVDFEIYRKSHILEKSQIDEIFEMDLSDAVILNSIATTEPAAYLLQRAEEAGVPVIDLFRIAMETLEKKTGQKAVRQPGRTRELDIDYFSKIEAIEFAVRYDDGKDPRGLLKADVALVGVSRTSKTPLSMLLANKNYKVANLPLVPEMPLPKEIFQVDPKRIIGLIISPEKLNDIREERLRSIGLAATSSYADQKRIIDELAYAENVFEQLQCKVLNVSEQTIEQTATKIMEILGENFGYQARRDS